MKRRRRKLGPPAGFEERVETFKAKRMRGLEQRQREHSNPAMRSHDSRDRFARCLFSFYGNRGVQAGAMNPQDVPKKLGQADEFWEEWERWKKIGEAEREQVAAIKAEAKKRFADLF